MDVWGPGWMWYGSLLDSDEGRPVIEICSAACKAKHEQQHGNCDLSSNPDVIIVDDPVDDSLTKNQRVAFKKWFTGTLFDGV